MGKTLINKEIPLTVGHGAIDDRTRLPGLADGFEQILAHRAVLLRPGPSWSPPGPGANSPAPTKSAECRERSAPAEPPSHIPDSRSAATVASNIMAPAETVATVMVPPRTTSAVTAAAGSS
ncbi:MAG: hypothetical protein QOI01_3033 [Mycobacterium sp.]|nr:hypothetical protein [Mycobacterium sp.]